MPDEPKQTDEQLAAAVAEAAKDVASGLVRASDGTYEVKLPTGQTYRGSTPEAVVGEVVKAQVNASTRITELGAETKAKDARIAELQRALDERSRVAAPATEASKDGFNMDQFAKIAETDFLAALDYADAHRFGFADPSEVRPAFTKTYSTAMEVADRIEIAKFHQVAEDFPGGDDPTKALLDRLQANGDEISLKNLLFAYDECKRSGQIKPLSAEEVNSERRPAPTLSGRPSGTAPTDTVSEFEKLPVEKMREVLRAQGHLK
jgi:hypothetical protein